MLTNMAEFLTALRHSLTTPPCNANKVGPAREFHLALAFVFTVQTGTPSS